MLAHTQVRAMMFRKSFGTTLGRPATADLDLLDELKMPGQGNVRRLLT
ncbi:hypothetical protein ACLQ29_18715 [Micromonospora sp. DT228]